MLIERLSIINCWSGGGKGSGYQRIIEKRYEKLAVKPVIRFTAPEGPNTAFNLGKSAVREGFEEIHVAGGDGTFNLVFSGMMASNVPLGQLPTLSFMQAGTGNNFAKNLGVPKSPIQALQVAETGQPIKLDFGRLILKNEERYFLNVASFGFDAWIAQVAQRFRGKYQFLPKESHYLLAALGEIIKGMRAFRISVNGGDPKELLLVAVTNGPTYGAIFRIAPGADLRDGLLDVCCIDRVGQMKALKDITRLLRGTHVNLPEVAMSQVSSLTISSDELLPCEIDGEVLPAEKEYKIEIIPQGLKALVPPMPLGA